MKTVTLDVALGYTIEQKTISLPLSQAEKILSGKKQSRFAMALRDENSARLISHFIRCPYCGYKVYAYPKEMQKAFHIKTRSEPRVSDDIIANWVSPQLSIFDTEFRPLQLNRVVDVKKNLVCPACDNTMKHNEGKRRIKITHHRHKIYIRAEIMDVFELFSMPYLAGGDVHVEFPICEVVCFNFKNGHTYVRLEDGDGRCIAVRDVTNRKDNCNSGAVNTCLLNDKYVKRAVKNMFIAQWGAELPFHPSELNINTLKMLTRFIGYDKKFYSAIPFVKGTLEIEDTFKPQARRMRNAYNIVNLYADSSLPKIKSVKRVFFGNTGLFFYLDECERLWHILDDPNYFVELLKESIIYQLLSHLHMHPVMFDFICDYVKIVGVRPLIKKICYTWRRFYLYSVNYGSMSEKMRQVEQLKWKKHHYVGDFGVLPSFAIPMSKTNDDVHECVIDDFEFLWLRSSADYEEAGEQLNNCLVEWRIDANPVMSIRKHGRVVAAVEVGAGYVYQAYTADNEPLYNVAGLEIAYDKWREKNNLTIAYRDIYEEDPFDDDDDLPF